LSIWLSDLFINNFLYAQYYPQFTWFYEGFYWQYISYILIGFLGISIQNNKPSYLLGMSLVGSVLFFLISNFAISNCNQQNAIQSSRPGTGRRNHLTTVTKSLRQPIHEVYHQSILALQSRK
jgi:hypothetical protein